ncbi:AbrB/MazE/SpoVT family DNA-binding domain-containing protein [Candidatus Dependentiae bacterium]|nr:AbrB/MazE/SpoVT family DNA-binding domain-containing protein [Candidatus Dependentiae bacterium]
MLKKLVKYGNSNAIILDKAILELLEIAEGSLLKIKTDGKSLIITLAAESSAETINQLPAQDDNQIAQAKDVSAIVAKYASVTEKLGELSCSEEYKRKLESLVEDYKNNTSSPEYAHALAELTYSYVPEARRMDSELLATELYYKS